MSAPVNSACQGGSAGLRSSPSASAEVKIQGVCNGVHVAMEFKVDFVVFWSQEYGVRGKIS